MLFSSSTKLYALCNTATYKVQVYKKDYAWNRGLLFEFWALDARLCKMQVDKMRNSRIALWLAARHRIGQWQQCRKCQLYFYWTQVHAKRILKFCHIAKVSQAQPSLTNCQLCQTVASTKMPGHSDSCIVILWKQDGRTGSKICMLLVCQKINVGLSQ